MKKILSMLAIVLIMPIFFAVNAQAEDVGGYAVVNPETKVVHGVIVATSSDPFENGGTMPMEYMGCPVGCIIVPQSTADQSGNVAGKFSHGETTVIYNSNSNVFEITESNTNQSQVVIESSSNTSTVETNISVFQSERKYEFGFQNFKNDNTDWQMTEVSPNQNTNILVNATTNEYICEESATICLKQNNIFSSTLVNESISLNERSTINQFETKTIIESKNKIREQLSLILSMLERWILD